MKAKRIALFILSLSLPFTIAGRESEAKIRLDIVEEQAAQSFGRLAIREAGANDDPFTIFDRAFSDYSTQFPSYLDITALNVTAKDAIDLADYDPNYVAPGFSDVMYDYQVKLVSSLPMADRLNFNSLRRQNYSFDRYVALNEGKYEDLNQALKYPHAEIPLDPKLPITPEHPDFTPINPNNTTQTTAVAISGILAILASAGLKDAAITAFTACISTMTTGLSASWIPVVGWALAVALVVGALIALTVIIVENWPKIKTAMDEMKAWFLEEFSKFASFIESFFSDATAKGRESVISSRRQIGDKTFEFEEVLADDVSAELAMTRRAQDEQNIFLMQIVKPFSFQVALALPVDEDFCVRYKTHCLGFSSYTWPENVARDLILRAGSGYTSVKPELHLHNPNPPQLPNPNKPKLPNFAFRHFHNFNADGTRSKGDLLHWVHSFFGPLYTWSTDGIGEVHNPLNAIQKEK